MDACTPIRVGLAGFGMSGRLFHAPFLHADPRFSLRRVYERASELAKEEYPEAEVVHSFEALLTEDIDHHPQRPPRFYGGGGPSRGKARGGGEAHRGLPRGG